MNRGASEESGSDTNENTGYSFDHRTRSSINNPYERPSTSTRSVTRKNQTQTNERSSNVGRKLTGAARRKRTPRQREVRLLKEIAHYQKTTKLLIPRAAFARVVREISLNVNPEITRYTVTALEAIQEACEIFLTQVLEDSYILTMHRKCVTLSVGDIQLIRSLKLHL